MGGTVSESTQGAQSRPPRLDETGLVAFLATQPDVVAAYLFGSLAEERATPHSDVDIAILLADGSDPMVVGDRQLQLADDVVASRLRLLAEYVDELHGYQGE